MYHLPEQDREQLMMRATECLDEGSSIVDKIRAARHMYDSWSDQLKREPHIHQLIEKLERCLEKSRAAMLEHRTSVRRLTVAGKGPAQASARSSVRVTRCARSRA